MEHEQSDGRVCKAGSRRSHEPADSNTSTQSAAEDAVRSVLTLEVPADHPLQDAAGKVGALFKSAERCARTIRKPVLAELLGELGVPDEAGLVRHVVGEAAADRLDGHR